MPDTPARRPPGPGPHAAAAPAGTVTGPAACSLLAYSLIIASACVSFAAIVAGETPPVASAPGVDRSAAERLVRRLGSGSLADRDAAARGLADLGPGVLPLVTSARRHAVGEPAHRLAEIEQLLVQQATERAVEPALVTFAADDAPAGDVLQQLFAQAGSRIEIAAPAKRRITWRGDRLTFWEAVDEVLDRSGLALEFDAPTGGRPTAAPLRIVDAGAGAPPSVAAGPLRVSVAGIERTGRAGSDERNRGARVTLRVAWEPRLEPLVVRLPARTLVAEGPGGESLPAAQRTAVIEPLIAPRRPWVDLPVLFGPPAVPLERLGMLRGTIVLWLAGMEHAFCFTDLPSGSGPSAATATRPLRMGQAEVRLLEARLDGERLQVRASVTYDEASEPLASHHSWLAARRLEASVAGDKPLDQASQRIEVRTDRGITVAAEFIVPAAAGRSASAGGKDLGIRWKLPIAIHELPVDFALRDVPLPAPQTP